MGIENFTQGTDPNLGPGGRANDLDVSVSLGSLLGSLPPAICAS